MQFRTVALALMGGASALAMSSAAFAQDAAADAEKAEEVITVTGTRVSNGNAMPTPVTVMSNDSLQNVRPSTLADTLQSIPVFAGSRSVLNTPLATGGSGAGNGAANQVNLRNVGSQRNLVLMDGRRLPPSSINNVIDVDMVPQMLVDRVETVTGGVSAVYGSDAVTGVVNFITKKNFTGLKVSGQYGISEVGDDQQYEGGLAFGTDFAGGRGHFQGSYEYRDSKGILRRSSRSWFTRPVVVGNGTAAVPYTLFNNGTMSALPFGGRITCTGTCSVNGYYFPSNNVASPYISTGTPAVITGANGTTTTIAGLEIGGQGGYYDSSLKTPLRSHQVYGRVDYDLTDDVKIFVVGSGNVKRNIMYAEDLTLSGMTLRSNNPYLSSAMQTALGAAGSTFSFSRIVNQDTRINPVVDSTQLLGVIGLEGTLAGKFDWSVGYSHGYSKLKTVLRNNVNEQKLRASLDAVQSGSQIVCGINVDAITTNDDASCTPFNPFGPSATSAEALAYVMDDTAYRAVTKTDDITAEISGPLFNNWAGPIVGALSAEWRQVSFAATSESESSALANCAGLFNCVQGRQSLWRQSFASNPLVKQKVWEVAAEAEVPLLNDAPLIKALSLNGAARYTKYDTSGSQWTWKGGLSWEVSDDLRFRGTISRDIRAPTLNDLFAPVSNVTNSQLDRLRNVSYVVSQDTVGNPDLKPEIGKTWTVGAVWKPGFLPGFSAAIDYYNIRIKDAIVLAPGFSPVYQDACYASGGTSIFCTLIERPSYTSTASTNAITKYYVKPFNIGEVKTYGVDVELNYATTLFGQALRLRGLGAWQPHVRYITPGAATIDQGGVAFGSVGMGATPKWRVTATASYNVTDAFRIDTQYRWRSKLREDGLATSVYSAGSEYIKPYDIASINLSYTIGSERLGNPELFLNIQNLFDAAPDPASSPGGFTLLGRQLGYSTSDDPVGRYYTMGFRAKF